MNAIKANDSSDLLINVDFSKNERVQVNQKEA